MLIHSLEICVGIHLTCARLIGNGPHHDAGMIAIAMHQLLQRGLMPVQQDLIEVSVEE